MNNRIRVTVFCIFSLLVLWGCGKGVVEKGNICLALGDYGMAESFFRERLINAPGDYGARLGLGKALLQRAAAGSGDLVSWSGGLVQLEACRTLNPTEEIGRLLADSYTTRSRIYLERRDTVSALKDLTNAIEYDGATVEPVNLAGIIYYRMGEAGKARMLFEKALRIDSLHPTAMFNLGMLCWEDDDFSCARAHWLKVLKLLPEDDDVLYWFARAEKKVRAE